MGKACLQDNALVIIKLVYQMRDVKVGPLLKVSEFILKSPKASKGRRDLPMLDWIASGQ